MTAGLRARRVELPDVEAIVERAPTGRPSSSRRRPTRPACRRAPRLLVEVHALQRRRDVDRLAGRDVVRVPVSVVEEDDVLAVRRRACACPVIFSPMSLRVPVGRIDDVDVVAVVAPHALDVVALRAWYAMPILPSSDSEHVRHRVRRRAARASSWRGCRSPGTSVLRSRATLELLRRLELRVLVVPEVEHAPCRRANRRAPSRSAGGAIAERDRVAGARERDAARCRRGASSAAACSGATSDCAVPPFSVP